MNQPETHSIQQEIAAIRDDGELPEDLNWEAQYRIMETPQTGSVQIKPEWLYGLEHPYNGLDEVLIQNGEAIFNDAGNGTLVAYRFDAELREGKLVILGTMHPAVHPAKDTYHAIDDEVIARAEIHPTMTNPRTAAIVQAFAEEHLRLPLPEIPDSESDALTADGRIPHGAQQVKYDVMLDLQETNPDFPSIDWIETFTDGNGMPKDMNPENDEADILLDILGTQYTVRFSYRINERGQVVATGAVHPAVDTGMTLEVNDAVTLAMAEITVSVPDAGTQAALREYTRSNLE